MFQTLMKVTKTIEVEVPGLGQRIKDARMNDHRSLKEICSQVGTSPMNWYRVEAEKQSIPIEKVRKIEEVLSVDLGVSFDDTHTEGKAVEG